MKKVSFDFDNTLRDYQAIQEYAKNLIKKEIDVHVVTARYEDTSKYSFSGANHKDLFSITDRLGIKRENIHFTNMEYKYKFFKDNQDFIWHLDDDPEEKYLMYTCIEYNKVVCVLHKNGDYFENKCDELLNIN